MSIGLFQNVIYKMCLEIIYFTYMYKKDFQLNNQQWLIYHKTTLNQTAPNCIKPNRTKPNLESFE